MIEVAKVVPRLNTHAVEDLIDSNQGWWWQQRSLLERVLSEGPDLVALPSLNKKNRWRPLCRFVVPILVSQHRRSKG